MSDRYDKPLNEFEEKLLVGESCGFLNIDKFIGGIRSNDLILIGSRPQIGRTSFLLSIANHIAVRKNKVALIVSLEMNQEKLGDRFLSMESGIEAHRLWKNDLDESDWDKLACATGKLSPVKIILETSPNADAVLIEKLAKNISSNLLKKSDFGMIGIDFLQEIGPHIGGRDRKNFYINVIKKLKEIANTVNVPIFLCSNLSTGIDQRGNKRPLVSDIESYDQIEKFLDLIFLLYRDQHYFLDSDDKGIAEVQIAKNRGLDIPSRPIRLAFLPHLTKFANLALRDDDHSYN